MSLINEALKKAQRVRTGDSHGTTAPMPGGGSRVAKRSSPRTSQQLVLIGAAAIVLVVLSVVATVFLVNRPAEAKAGAASTPRPSSPSAGAAVTAPPSPLPQIVVPMGMPAAPASNAGTTPAPALAQTAPPVSSNPTARSTDAPLANPTSGSRMPSDGIPAPGRPPTGAPTLETTAATPAVGVAQPPTAAPQSLATSTPTPPTLETVAPPPAPPLVPKLDERASLFVDSVKVAGVRAAGNDSRVLLNERVYRINEIVERTFGLRLSKVESNSVTFTDANGAVYVKHF